MSRLGSIDLRRITDYRPNCVQNMEIQQQIIGQLNLNLKPYTNSSSESKEFLQKYAKVIIDTERNKIFNQSQVL